MATLVFLFSSTKFPSFKLFVNCCYCCTELFLIKYYDMNDHG